MTIHHSSSFSSAVVGLVSCVATMWASANSLGWDISVTPQPAGTLQPVYARITNVQTCFVDPQTLRLSQDGSTIRITTQAIPGCLPTGGGQVIDVSLGSFPAGSFNVSVRDAGGVEVASTSFSVDDTYSGRTHAFPIVDYTDHWWNSQESGWGMSIMQHPDGQLFAVWFVYNNATQPTWYTLQPGQWSDFKTFTGTVYKTTGPYFGGPFDPRQVGVTQAGTATLSFDSPSTGTFNYIIDGVTSSKSIARLPF